MTSPRYIVVSSKKSSKSSSVESTTLKYHCLCHVGTNWLFLCPRRLTRHNANKLHTGGAHDPLQIRRGGTRNSNYPNHTEPKKTWLFGGLGSATCLLYWFKDPPPSLPSPAWLERVSQRMSGAQTTTLQRPPRTGSPKVKLAKTCCKRCRVVQCCKVIN